MHRARRCRWAGWFSVFCLSLHPPAALADEAGTLADWLKANPESMGRGMLSLSASTHPSGDSTNPGVAAIDPLTPLLLPLIEGLSSSAGQYLVSQSGKDRQSVAMDGYTASYFYCVETRPQDSNRIGSALLDSNPADQEIVHHINPSKLTIATPPRATTGQRAFSADLVVEGSRDGSAFRLKPERIAYRAPIMNQRAYGVLLQVSFEDLQGKVNSVILPLGFTACGRVGHVCDHKTNDLELQSLASTWLPLPPTSAASRSSLLSRLSTKPELVMPLTIKARILEISTFNQFLAFIGDFLTTNKSKVSEVVVASLPPLTAKERAAARQAQADLIIAKQIYQIARNDYLLTVRDNKSCNEQLEAWQKAIRAGLDAGLLSGLVETPPPACQSPAPSLRGSSPDRLRYRSDRSGG